VSVDLHSRVLSGNVFQTDGAAMEKARREIWLKLTGKTHQEAMQTIT